MSCNSGNSSSSCLKDEAGNFQQSITPEEQKMLNAVKNAGKLSAKSPNIKYICNNGDANTDCINCLDFTNKSNCEKNDGCSWSEGTNPSPQPHNVNKKRVNASSYSVKEEDIIEVKEKSKSLTIIEGCLSSKERDVPEYILSDEKNKTAKLVRVPKFADIPYPTMMEPKLVIEYYSR